ncbi:hypothetical protein K3495_g2363 [Podosphaera aphanis]|nr:hypothetical protein K3495_g2363 [Podosphaera aphanis]
MPVVKTTHHAADSAKDRVPRTTKTKGLARNQKALHASEALIPGKFTSRTDTEMIDAENISSIDSSPKTEDLAIRALDPTNAPQLNLITPKSTLGSSNTKQATPPRTGNTAKANASAGKTTGANEVPFELRPQIEAEKHRATLIASNVSICTAAINGVENALSLLVNEENLQYIRALKAHFRATIAQFATRNPELLISTLPPRPPCPAYNTKHWEHPPAGSTRNQPIQISEPITAEPSTWASVTKRGQQKSMAPPKRYPPLDKTRDSFSVSVKNTTGVRDAVAQHLGLSPDTIEHVYRVPTGFALKAKDVDSRQALLESAEAFTAMEAKLEKASDLVVLRISTVPVALNTRLGRVQITEEMVLNEITRITKATPLKARPHGKSRLGAIQ